MPTRMLTQIASQLRREIIPLDAAAETDRDLLDRFLDEHDEGAFESLVRRHDRLVRSAVAKVLPNTHDVEDAFQATFLVLVRRAKSIDWRAGLGSWLYGVAHRVAVKARDASRTRSRKEKETSAKPRDPGETSDLSWREACALLHEELDKLTDRYRLPLLLCYLEGKTRDEAAATLRVTAGSVKGRLERGREMLRDRLARRGVTLSAGLLATLAGSPASASSTASIAAVLSVVGGAAPPRVLALTRDATASALLTKLTKSVTAILGLAAIASTVIGSSAMRATDATDEKGKVPTPPGDVKPAEQVPKQPLAPAAPAMVTIKGHLFGPDKLPEPGATVALWANGKKLGETTTTKEQMFQITVPGPLPGGTRVVATKPGFAPDWATVPTNPEKTPIELHAIPDDSAIAGRVTDLEGHPVANLRVDVERIGRPMPGKTIEEHIRMNPEYRSRGTTALFDLDTISPEAIGIPSRVTTDKDGRFKIVGVGKDRSVRITTRGETTEHFQVRIVTREISAKLEQHGPFGLHGATFTIRLAPSRGIEGIVRDRKTGEPVGGMTVTDLTHEICGTATDKGGRFRLIGLKKDSQYRLGTGSQGEAPYFDANVTIDDTPGLDAITTEIKTYRGIIVSGRVTDSSGLPVAGHIFYTEQVDNDRVNDYPGIRDAYRITSFWGHLDRDGRYRLLVIPGPSVIGVCGSPEDRFPRMDAQQELAHVKSNSFPGDALHAFEVVDFDPKDPKTLVRDFTLVVGKTRTLTILTADGKRPDKLFGAGQSESMWASPVSGDTLKLTGLTPKRARAVVLMDDAKTVGAVATVTGDVETPTSVTLEKLGSIAGRVLDADGTPTPGADVQVWLELDRDKYDNLPLEAFRTLGVNGIAPGAWAGFTSRTAKTDKDGRFTLTGLLPGQKYRLIAGYNTDKKGGEILHEQSGVSVKVGHLSDLGDLKPKK